MVMQSLIRIGIPSKGRLKSDVEKFFRTNSLELIKNGLEREYVLNFESRKDIQPVLMNASDIPLEVRKGNIDLGITGKDLLYEKVTDWSKTIIEIRQLNFGFANLVIALPRFWVDVNTLDDLDDIAHFYRKKSSKRLKIATKYQNLVREFFVTRELVDYQIVESQGATEGAIKNGLADVIADITSTGETLKQNNLKQLNDGLILKSAATIFANKAYIEKNDNNGSLKDFLRLVGSD
ncbi:ATP phosphoribosyltransferase [bacterium TMED277]|nr:MAG: ATP phosphoribosyltransferase [bacterium TMED277]